MLRVCEIADARTLCAIETFLAGCSSSPGRSLPRRPPVSSSSCPSLFSSSPSLFLLPPSFSSSSSSFLLLPLPFLFLLHSHLPYPPMHDPCNCLCRLPIWLPSLSALCLTICMCICDVCVHSSVVCAFCCVLLYVRQVLFSCVCIRSASDAGFLS